MKIAIIGAGATGGCIGGRLAEAGQEVTRVSRGTRLDAIRAGGLRIESRRRPVIRAWARCGPLARAALGR